MANETAPTALPRPRRVVTGLDAEGRSHILIDGAAEGVIWSTDVVPADNSAQADAGGVPFTFPAEGTRFVFSDFPPGRTSPMHTTDTIDYLVIATGEITFITETQEVLLKAGDVLIDRGARHGWRNDSDTICRMINVIVPAHPIGAGSTVG